MVRCPEKYYTWESAKEIIPTDVSSISYGGRSDAVSMLLYLAKRNSLLLHSSGVLSCSRLVLVAKSYRECSAPQNPSLRS